LGQAATIPASDARNQRLSWRASGWAKATRGHKSAGQKLVLLILADYYDDEKGYAWPSQKRLCEDCEMPERTLRWCLSNLISSGFVTVLQKGNQYQPTKYELSIAAAQACEPARCEPANIAAASEPAISNMVNRQYDASEPATPRMTSLQEPTIKPTKLISNVLPEWFETLSQDERWTGKNPFGYIQRIETTFLDIDLNLEAHNAYEWLQGPKGKKKKVLRGFWTNWLKNARASPSPQSPPSQNHNGGGHGITRSDTPTDSATKQRETQQRMANERGHSVGGFEPQVPHL
jgi:hypothetical protein